MSYKSVSSCICTYPQHSRLTSGSWYKNGTTSEDGTGVRGRGIPVGVDGLPERDDEPGRVEVSVVDLLPSSFSPGPKNLLYRDRGIDDFEPVDDALVVTDATEGRRVSSGGK